MSIEGPKKTESELEAALARLRKTMNESPTNFRNFETPNGFSGTIEFFDSGKSNLTLQKGAEISLFEITLEGQARFMELRGADNELLTKSNLIKQHQNEADRLIAENELEQFKK